VTGPTILALQADSAWFVIVAVSLVTLPAVVLLRRLIDRPGGLASGILLSLPLVLPLVAAVLYGHPVLPEVAILQPAVQAMLEDPSKAGPLMFLRAGGRVLIPYSLAASTGPWLLVVGGAATVFMLLRRVRNQTEPGRGTWCRPPNHAAPARDYRGVRRFRRPGVHPALPQPY
jgi:hypothetical protein